MLSTGRHSETFRENRWYCWGVLWWVQMLLFYSVNNGQLWNVTLVSGCFKKHIKWCFIPKLIRWYISSECCIFCYWYVDSCWCQRSDQQFNFNYFIQKNLIWWSVWTKLTWYRNGWAVRSYRSFRTHGRWIGSSRPCKHSSEGDRVGRGTRLCWSRTSLQWSHSGTNIGRNWHSTTGACTDPHSGTGLWNMACTLK